MICRDCGKPGHASADVKHTPMKIGGYSTTLVSSNCAEPDRIYIVRQSALRGHTFNLGIRFDDSDRSLSEAHDRASFPTFTHDKHGIDAATALRDYCQAFLDEQAERDRVAYLRMTEGDVEVLT